jgi:hypothetical protein
MGATCGCGDEKDVINEVSTDPVSLFFQTNIQASTSLVSGHENAVKSIQMLCSSYALFDFLFLTDVCPL